jgi:predicted nuclease of predicted toxin-antitoxin system
VAEADCEVWEAAQRDERFLITQDLDFSDVRRFVPGSHRGILLVRLRFLIGRASSGVFARYSSRKK